MKAKKQTATKQASIKAKATESDTTEPKTAKVTTPAKADAKKKLSQIEAAVAMLAKAGEAMNCQVMVEAMGQQGLWTSPGGATPASTLYASILREINAKGKHARFKKINRGQFALAARKQTKVPTLGTTPHTRPQVAASSYG